MILRRSKKKPPPQPIGFYLEKIDRETPDFEDDGLSCFPDWIYKYLLRLDISPSGRVHDWHYCTRCQPIGTMNQDHRLYADLALYLHSRELLRRRKPTENRFLRFVRATRSRLPRLAPHVLYRGVRLGGGGNAWNSCGPQSGDRCRHNMKKPKWMEKLYDGSEAALGNGAPIWGRKAFRHPT